MSANLESSAMATGLEKVSFHSNPKEGQCQKMFKLLYSSVQFSRSVVSDSLRPHRRQPTRLPRPWDSPAISKCSLNIWFTYFEAWLGNFEITLLACEISGIVQYFENSLALPFFVIWVKTDLCQACGHCRVFQICWSIECGTFTASHFRIWNNSTGIPSPSLALFVVMLPKTHLTSHSRMSGSRWVITPL